MAQSVESAVSSDFSPIQKELRDKLAWSVGTTLSVPYGKRSPVMIWADQESTRITKRHFRSSQPEPSNVVLIEGTSQAQTYAEWAKKNPLSSS